MDLAEVRKVAALARLALSDDELRVVGSQLNDILGYVRLLDELDLSGVEPMPHPVAMENCLRDDIRVDSLPRNDALRNAPQTDGRCFLVPQILEDKGAGSSR